MNSILYEGQIKEQDGIPGLVLCGKYLGFGTGNPRVGFSHTVPEPVDTVPVTGNTLRDL